MNDISLKGGGEDSSSISSDEQEMYQEYIQSQNRYYVEKITDSCPNSPADMICFLCGLKGHSRQQCKESICYNCYRPGHSYRDCNHPRKRFDDVCINCHMFGHGKKDCDLNWRKYVFVSKLKEKSFSKIHLQKNCYCCSSNRHMGDECPFRKKGNYSIYHTPMREYLKKLMYKSIPSNKSSKLEKRNAHLFYKI